LRDVFPAAFEDNYLEAIGIGDGQRMRAAVEV
jgi:hypothetical protein